MRCILRATQCQHNVKYNKAVKLPRTHQQTSQRAHLFACLRGLKKAAEIQSENIPGTLSRSQRIDPCNRLRHVVIKTHAEYVVKGMTEWISKWEANGYTNAKGGEVVNADLFKLIERRILALNNNRVHVISGLFLRMTTWLPTTLPKVL